MYDLARHIQDDRRRQACEYRRASHLPSTRTFNVGRYRLTLDREVDPKTRMA